MIILIDQDGPLADFEKGFLKNWRIQFPGEFFIPLNRRRTFRLINDYPKHLRDKVESIYCAPNFYRDLSLVKGSVKALKTMIKLGYDVRICTSPLSCYENCVLEKYQWVEKHFGKDFTKQIILTKDKTLVKGHFLIDDRPNYDGISKPDWEYII